MTIAIKETDFWDWWYIGSIVSYVEWTSTLQALSISIKYKGIQVNYTMVECIKKCNSLVRMPSTFGLTPWSFSMALARRLRLQSLERNTGASNGNTRCRIVWGFILTEFTSLVVYLPSLALARPLIWFNCWCNFLRDF